MQLKYTIGDNVWFVTPLNGNVYNRKIQHIGIDLLHNKTIRVQAYFAKLAAYVPLEKCFSSQEEAIQNYLKNKYPNIKL